KPVTMTGTVTSVEWVNPHIHFSIEVEGEDGAVAEWRFEGFPPNMLVRQGWHRETLKPGDTVTVSGWLARKEPHLGSVRSVRLSDGRELTAGPPASIGGRWAPRCACGLAQPSHLAASGRLRSARRSRSSAPRRSRRRRHLPSRTVPGRTPRHRSR